MTTRRAILGCGAAVALFDPRARAADSGPFNVRTFGASGDGKTLDTAAINQAIDAAAAAGGARSCFPRAIISATPFA